MTIDRTRTAFRMFCEVMQSVDEQGENTERQLALEAIEAIIDAMLSESETRALIGAIVRSVNNGKIDDDDGLEYGKTAQYLVELEM